MFKIPIYKSEAVDGLVDAIRSNCSIAYCSLVQPVKINEDNLRIYTSAGSKKFDLDILYPTRSVLVSSTWNKNDDIFGLKEIWTARHTPVHKPTNIDHDHNQIVGHITDTWVIDSEGNTVDDGTVIDDLPEYIHICNGAVIYKYYSSDTLTERAQKLIEQIEAGEKYVSMECLFPDFDYGVIDEEGNNYIIARNQDTAFLTKHLRAYGGTGNFNKYKVGRYIKSMVFSGKGYVDEPANPESIIFTEDKPNFNFSVAIYKNKFNLKNGVNITMSETPQMSAANLNDSKEIKMSETNDFYKEELANAKKEITELAKANKELTSSVASANVEQLKAEIEELKSKIDSLSVEKDSVSSELTETKASLDAVQLSLKEVAESKEKLEEAVEQAKSEKIFAERVNSLVEIGFSKERAEKAVEKFKALSDEQFEEAKSLFVETNTKVSETEESDDLNKTLESAEVEDSEAEVGAAESEELDDTKQLRETAASYFADRLGIACGSDE